MAGLKKSEKRLLVVFVIALFIVANLLADGIFAKRKAEANAAINAHEADIEEYEMLLNNRAKRDLQRSWLTSKQPRYLSEESAATDVESHITRCADISGVTVDSRKPTSPIETPHYVQIAVEVNVSGEAGSVSHFVSLLQSQDTFYVLPAVNFVADRRDPTILRCGVTVGRWYSKEQPAPAPAPVGEGIVSNAGN